MAEKKIEPYKYHPIQLIKLSVLELSITAKTEVATSNDTKQPINEGTFAWKIGYSEYDKTEETIALKVSIEIGEDEEDCPFILKVSLAGIFKVDEDKFPLVHLDHWVRNNAPLILYPYLREQVYSLSSKAGFTPILLPLFEVPTFKINKKEN